MNQKESSAFERFLQFDAFYDASYKVCRNVRWKDSTINFEESRIETILRTEEDLRNNEYLQLVFSCFSIIERGKPRDIRACHINDRLVQNALCEQVLIPELVPKFIYDNCATLKNRGIDFAINRAKKHFQSAYKLYNGSFYALRIDIRKYFDSIDHKALKKAAKKLIKDQQILQLTLYLIDTFSFKLTKDITPIEGKIYYIVSNGKYIKCHNLQFFHKKHKYYEYEEKSLGLGSQTSQLLALLALNEVDHYIKEQLHIKFYGRYMDDIYIFFDKYDYLVECRDKIGIKLNTIGLSLNMKKTTISKIQAGDNTTPFKYLKWNFYLTKTGGIIQKPFKIKLTKERRKLRKMKELLDFGQITPEAISDHYQGWRAHINKGNTFYIIQDMDNYFVSLFGKGVEIR